MYILRIWYFGWLFWHTETSYIFGKKLLIRTSGWVGSSVWDWYLQTSFSQTFHMNSNVIRTNGRGSSSARDRKFPMWKLCAMTIQIYYHSEGIGKMEHEWRHQGCKDAGLACRLQGSSCLAQRRNFQCRSCAQQRNIAYCSKEFGKDRSQYRNTHEIDIVELVRTKLGSHNWGNLEPIVRID
jgi:hypothetical protein